MGGRRLAGPVAPALVLLITVGCGGGAARTSLGDSEDFDGEWVSEDGEDWADDELAGPEVDTEFGELFPIPDLTAVDGARWRSGSTGATSSCGGWSSTEAENRASSVTLQSPQEDQWTSGSA